MWFCPPPPVLKLSPNAALRNKPSPGHFKRSSLSWPQVHSVQTKERLRLRFAFAPPYPLQCGLNSTEAPLSDRRQITRRRGAKIGLFRHAMQITASGLCTQAPAPSPHNFSTQPQNRGWESSIAAAVSTEKLVATNNTQHQRHDRRRHHHQSTK